MGRPTADVTDAELAVLRLLWERGNGSIRELADVLYPEGGSSGYATVQKLLDRLETKRCVRRERGGPVRRFRPAVDRDTLIGRRLQDVAESLCNGAIAPLLSHLVQHSGALPADDRRALRELVERLDRER